MGKLTNRFSQFDKSSGSSSAGDIGKTILVSIFFGIAALLSLIVIIISFTQVREHGRFSWDTDTDICSLNTTKSPVRFVVPERVFKDIDSDSSSDPDVSGFIPTGTTTDDATTTGDSTTGESTTGDATTGDTTTGDAAKKYIFEKLQGGFAENEFERYKRDVVVPPKVEKYYNKYFSKKQVIECPWSSGSSGTRILAHFIALVTCLCVFILVMKCEYWQAFWFCLICSIVCVVFIFIVFVRDATTLGDARKFCEKEADVLTNQNPYNPLKEKITCDLSPHIAIGVLNIVWFLWAANTGLLYVYVKKWKVVIYS